jgi:hypothetical protein
MSNVIATTGCEQNQNFNRITRFLDSGRYTSLLRIAGELSAKMAVRPMRALEIGCGPGTARSSMPTAPCGTALTFDARRRLLALIIEE